MSNDLEKEKASRICSCCQHLVMLTEIDEIDCSPEEILALFPSNHYCKVGHHESDFECKDFEPDREIVRCLISDLVENLKLAGEKEEKKK